MLLELLTLVCQCYVVQPVLDIDQPVLGDLVAFAQWSFGFSTAQPCSPQPHLQHVFNDIMHWYGWGAHIARLLYAMESGYMVCINMYTHKHSHIKHIQAFIVVII